MFYQTAYKQKNLKSLCCEIGSCDLDSKQYYVEKYCKRAVCYCYQKPRQTNFFKKNFGKCSHSREFNPENSNILAITLRQHASKQEFLREIMENLAHQSPRGNMIG